MKPLVAIVGRPNVGKSTFFNRMLGDRVAIVEDLPGTTRDRLYGDTDWNGRTFTLIDTGGLEFGSDIPVGQVGLTGQPGDLMNHVQAQAELAIEEADVIVFMVDARTGITASDEEVADVLRRTKKPIIIAANKADNANRRMDAVEFYNLGLGEPIVLSSVQGVGTGDVLDRIVEELPESDEDEEDEEDETPRIAIVGRPNVGKSSLLNAIVGVDRAIVSTMPGTTRDAIDTEMEFQGRKLVMIDTAGIRRRGRIGPGVEKYSVLRSSRAIERCDVALILIDASEGIAAQDMHIAGEVSEAAKGVVIIINKWDLAQEQRRAERDEDILPHADDEIDSAEHYRKLVLEEFKFMPYAPVIFASAKTGYHVQSILETVVNIAEMRFLRIPTSRLNEVVQDAIRRHHPAIIRNKPLKVYYATQTRVNPPTFTFFVNDTQAMHFSYERYLENRLREAFGFKGTGIRLQFRPRSSKEEK
ncbi:MAG: ribosome biogenesis GTPase Der [Ktedonobacteraceae bacterium]